MLEKMNSFGGNVGFYYAQIAPYTIFVRQGDISYCVVQNTIVAASEPNLLGKEPERMRNGIKVSYWDLSDEHKFKRKELYYLEDRATFPVYGKYAKLIIDLKDYCYTITPDAMCRNEFFMDYVRKSDPFSSMWGVKNPYTLKSEGPYGMYDSELDTIVEHFSHNPNTEKMKYIFSSDSQLKETGGHSRRVVLSDDYVFKYSRNTMTAEVGQQEIELFYSLRGVNHLILPLETVFYHKHVGTVLVYPRLNIPQDGSDLNQSTWENRQSYLSSLDSDPTFYFTVDGSLVMFDGTRMYRGSLNWAYKEEIPFFFDMGECFRSTKCGFNLN